jgi:hypothetical protein
VASLGPDVELVARSKPFRRPRRAAIPPASAVAHASFEDLCLELKAHGWAIDDLSPDAPWFRRRFRRAPSQLPLEPELPLVTLERTPEAEPVSPVPEPVMVMPFLPEPPPAPAPVESQGPAPEPELPLERVERGSTPEVEPNPVLTLAFDDAPVAVPLIEPEATAVSAPTLGEAKRRLPESVRAARVENPQAVSPVSEPERSPSFVPEPPSAPAPVESQESAPDTDVGAWWRSDPRPQRGVSVIPDGEVSKRIGVYLGALESLTARAPRNAEESEPEA